jgi:hypothetical protein
VASPALQGTTNTLVNAEQPSISPQLGGSTAPRRFACRAGGFKGEFGLSSEFSGEVFEPLKCQVFFKTFVLYSAL